VSDDEQGNESEATLLASLYLDDEATADERALVETDPDALREVERFGDVRTVLGATVPIASLADREAHLAGALDVWERMSDLERSGEVTPSDGIAAAAAAAVTTPSTGSRGSGPVRRPRTGGPTGRQWLLGAAAGLTVLAGAGFALNSLTSGDDSEPSDVAADATPDDPLTELGDLEAAEAAEVNGENVGTEVAPNLSDLSDEASGPGLPADAAAADESTGAGETLPGPEQPAPPPDEGTLEIDNPDDLAAYASLAMPSLRATSTANDDIEFDSVFGGCESQLGVEAELEPIIYAGTPVVVGIDLDNSVVLAYTAEDCAIVETAPVPDETERNADVGDANP